MSCYEIVRDENGQPIKVIDPISGRRYPPGVEERVLKEVAGARKKAKRQKRVTATVMQSGAN
jgi:hypothetical protein